MNLAGPLQIATGIDAFDEQQQAIWRKLAQFSAASDAEVPARYTELLKQIEEAFGEEEKWMEEIGYPGIHAHREQHARLLGGLHHVDSQIKAGNVAMAREVGKLLPRCLEFHMSTMDMALATAMQFVQAEAEAEAADENSLPPPFLLEGIYKNQSLERFRREVHI